MPKTCAAHETLVALIFIALTCAIRPVAALDKVKVGIPATEAFSFMAVDFGNDLGIYAKNSIEVERVILLGSAKLHQAMTAGAIDIAAGAGTDFAFLVIPEFLADGKFRASALKVMARSFVELGQLDNEPDLTKYYTEGFLPRAK